MLEDWLCEIVMTETKSFSLEWESNPDRCFSAVFSHVFWSKLLSKNLGDSVEEGGRDGREEDVGEDVDDGGGHGEGGEQEAGVLRLGCWGCGCQLGTVVERQLKEGQVQLLAFGVKRLICLS